jgi:UDP-glucose:(heptosyl)LPS alpha-1,3-glucosyltransferase
MLRAPSFLRALSFAFFCKRAVTQARCDLVFSLERTLRQDIYRAGDGCHREWLAQRQRFLSPLKRATMWLNPLHAALLWLEKRTFSPRNTRAIIANSARGKEEIVRHYQFPADQIYVVHNGVDCVRFDYVKRARRGNEFVLLFVGTGFERKGLEFCVRALAELPPHVVLHVVGKGSTRPYARLAQKLGVASRVKCLGTTKDVKSAYAAADLFVLPAIYEPFANVCLEAMATGLPVVTSRINGASEVIEQGKNGAIVEDPNDIDALAELVRAFLDRELWEEASLRARKTAESLQFYTNVDRTLEVIQLLAKS